MILEPSSRNVVVESSHEISSIMKPNKATDQNDSQYIYTSNNSEMDKFQFNSNVMNDDETFN